MSFTDILRRTKKENAIGNIKFHERLNAQQTNRI